MNILLNAQIQCVDGHCGRVSHVIVDPATQTLTHLVVKAHRFGHEERLVSASQIRDMTPHTIYLRCTRHELATSEPFLETKFVRVTGPDYRNSIPELWPCHVPIRTEWRPRQAEAIPRGELSLHCGTEVEAVDGTVGKVDEFLIDPESMHITHLVLHEGHIWHHKDVTIPVSQIVSFGEKSVSMSDTAGGDI